MHCLKLPPKPFVRWDCLPNTWVAPFCWADGMASAKAQAAEPEGHSWKTSAFSGCKSRWFRHRMRQLGPELSRMDTGSLWKGGRWWWGLCPKQLSGTNLCMFVRNQRVRNSRAHGSGETNKRDIIVGISHSPINQEGKTDRTFFKQLRSYSGQTRKIPVFCNWKNLPIRKPSAFSHKVITHNIFYQAYHVSVSSKVLRRKFLIRRLSQGCRKLHIHSGAWWATTDSATETGQCDGHDWYTEGQGYHSQTNSLAGERCPWEPQQV